MVEKKQVQKINDYVWGIPVSARGDMRVPARIWATEEMLDEMARDQTLVQAMNVATLPGIQKVSLVMPDGHEGYGFPIGGVAGMQYPDGVISPGGIGFDINCGVRLLRARLSFDEVKMRLGDLGTAIFREVPSGVGRGGRLELTEGEFDRVFREGARWMIEKGYGKAGDHEYLEARGSLEDADPSRVSRRARDRGRDQLGTMGAGNHFVEVERVDEIFDAPAAQRSVFSKIRSR